MNFKSILYIRHQNFEKNEIVNILINLNASEQNLCLKRDYCKRLFSLLVFFYLFIFINSYCKRFKGSAKGVMNIILGTAVK